MNKPRTGFEAAAQAAAAAEREAERRSEPLPFDIDELDILREGLRMVWLDRLQRIAAKPGNFRPGEVADIAQIVQGIANKLGVENP